jgi:spore coat protein U-like protein
MTRRPLLRATALALPFAAVALVALPMQALAGDTGTLSVTATVQNTCALDSGTLSFGQYLSGQASNLDATGQINYTNCSGTISFELDGGQSGNINGRKMKFGANELNYQIYRNSTRTAVFGQGADKQDVFLLVPQNGKINVFGRIPGGQVVPAGSYADAVIIALAFD